MVSKAGPAVSDWVLTSAKLATLAVQEAMGLKVDREAVATLVLPQLWTMSMGPSQCSSAVCSVASG